MASSARVKEACGTAGLRSTSIVSGVGTVSVAISSSGPVSSDMLRRGFMRVARTASTACLSSVGVGFAGALSSVVTAA